MMTRAEFMVEVSKAADLYQKRRRRMRVMSEASLDALAEARQKDPLRGVRAARLVPRCGKVKSTDRRPCKSPCVRGGTRCWRHGGLRQNPSHPANIRRHLDGTFAHQTYYRLELKTLGEYWFKLSVDEKRYLQGLLAPKAYRDLRILDWGSRALLARSEDNCHDWFAFMKLMDARRLLAS